VWVTGGTATLLLMPVYAWWTYAPRLPDGSLSSDATVEIARGTSVVVRPRGEARRVSLVWLAGCLVPADAYVPLARHVARHGYVVHLVGLPYRCAPLPGHRARVVADVRALLSDDSQGAWVLGGHSKGATIACDVAADPPAALRGLVVAGTTHPRDVDLSRTGLVVTKVVATRDRIAPPATSEVRRHLLPPDATWVSVDGGNHSQFGWYGWQLGDGRATISRDAQHRQLVEAVLHVLERVGAPDERSVGRLTMPGPQ
jgi:pimeloyl-ACP methyl ester carboxylesterase